MKRNIPKWQKTSKLHYLMLGLITFLSIFPFYWMFIVSSNTDAEISKTPPSLVPGPRFLEVSNKVLNAEGVYFSQALINTFIVGLTAVQRASVLYSFCCSNDDASKSARNRSIVYHGQQTASG